MKKKTRSKKSKMYSEQEVTRLVERRAFDMVKKALAPLARDTAALKRRLNSELERRA